MCAHCGDWVDYYQFEEHCRTKHDLYKCRLDYCWRYFKGEDGLKEHQEEAHFEKCPKCDVRMLPEKLKEHKRRAHNETDCCLC